MNIEQIEKNIQELTSELSEVDFVYDLLSAYGIPKAAITRLKNGTYNLIRSKSAQIQVGTPEVLWKKKLYFKHIQDTADLHVFIDDVRKLPLIVRNEPRFILVTDFVTLLALDTKTGETLDIPLKRLDKHFAFFLPWAGMEKAHSAPENPADVKAAEKMARLYDFIRQDNPGHFDSQESLHNLNVFLSRLLFCYFAEDTEIFPAKLFTDSVASHTQPDGSDLSRYLDQLFVVLNDNDRVAVPSYLTDFPYVNGGLFAQTICAPPFTSRSRKLLIECGRDLNWRDINPDIFGSMIQAVVHPEQRSGMGMHYTSVANIMRVIEPLVLDQYKEEFGRYKDDGRKLEALLQKLSSLRIFDPACGSGNFLIIAYKELRKLEMAIFLQLQAISPQRILPLSKITLGQFYGIELDDFAHEVAILSLWLAEHQMNVAFKQTFGRSKPALPLREGGKITRGNALEIDWQYVCPLDTTVDTYVIGNPPYVSYIDRSPSQRDDMERVFQDSGNVKRLDYIAGFFKTASDYIRDKRASYAFVSTNSICQGEQPSLLWPYIFSLGLEISFAHQSFRWTNNAKGKAGVTCVIVGVQNSAPGKKLLFSAGGCRSVKAIGPYLTEGNPIVMKQQSVAISSLPEMAVGSSAIDGGHLILSSEERAAIVLKDGSAARFIKPYIGGGDFIDGKERFCLWIEDTEVTEALRSPAIADRIEKCRQFRLSAGRDAKKAASVPYRFYYRKYQDRDAVVFPMTSSERREYIPIGFASRGTVPSHGVFVIYDAATVVFGLLSSRMHMVWTHAIAGRLESRIRYSVNLVYNNFPVPSLPKRHEQQILSHTLAILDERERYSDRTLSELYDPKLMPSGLKEAHAALDDVVDRCYRSKPFETDAERLEHMFSLYEEIAGLKNAEETKNA